MLLRVASAALCAQAWFVAHAADVYVSPTGSSSGTGTITSPFASIQSAVDAVTAGSTIYLRGGTYKPTVSIKITRKGTSSAPYTMRPYSTEKVIIDGDSMPYTPAALDASLPSADRGILHIEGASYWSFYNLSLTNGPYGVYAADSSNNLFHTLSTHDNYETGFQLQGAAANNQILYLDSYGNRDPRKNGESADGFACKEGSGAGNVLRGARLWDNVDDGLDLWEFRSAVTVEDTVSWGNGFNRWGFSPFEGDGNGFKLGGGDAGETGAADHVVRNSIAFGNAAGGFVDNSQPGNFVIEGNTAWSNGGTGFKFGTAVATLTANVAAVNKGGDTSLSSAQKASGNSWNSKTWTNSSFLSLDPSTMEGTRQASGKVVGSNFLLPADGSDLGATTYW